MKKKTNNFWNVFNNYFKIYTLQERKLSEKTVSSYYLTWLMLLDYTIKIKGVKESEITFSTFSKDVVLEFILKAGGSGKSWNTKTKNLRVTAIRSFFKYAKDCDVSVTSLYIDLLSIEIEKEVKSNKIEYFTKDEIHSILLVAKKEKNIKAYRNFFFILFMYYTASRVGEMLSLRLSSFNMERKVVTLLGKGNKERLIPLGDSILTCLEKYLSQR